ncbi:S41 family peptidase [Marinomonas spartinae]|uniref:S41 family peptidase n=1 Tax=Marinomonas spartinae TaxID=1792290 RepID=UPI0018F13189|nr:S41 family peptidase [Marinomonas spartinae]MBJ7555087.1 hypothetical protein [Marinomonas spartinae]
MKDLESILVFWKNTHRFFCNFINDEHKSRFDRIFFDAVANFKPNNTDSIFRELLHCLNDAHTDVFKKNRNETKNYGINVKFHDSKFIVLGVSDRLKGTISIGSEVLKINNKDLLSVVDENMKRVSYSRREHGISRALKFIFSDRHCNNPVITITEPNGNRKDVKLNELYGLNEFSLNGSIPSFTSKMNRFNRDTAYIHLSSFTNETEINDISDKLRSLSVTSKLIIDLRGNSGGNGLFCMKLLSSLTSKNLHGARWRALAFNAFYTAYFNNIDPKQNISNNSDWYEGESEIVFPNQPISVKNICILIDSETISAAEDFLIYAKQMDNCVIIGETSAGSSGLPINLDLGGDYWCQISAKHDFICQPNDFIRVGIAPDYTIRHSPEALNKGIDAPLEFALNLT